MHTIFRRGVVKQKVKVEELCLAKKEARIRTYQMQVCRQVGGMMAVTMMVMIEMTLVKVCCEYASEGTMCIGGLKRYEVGREAVAGNELQAR